MNVNSRRFQTMDTFNLVLLLLVTLVVPVVLLLPMYYITRYLERTPFQISCAPYRRAFSAYIERDDGWAITSMNVERELVTLNSKVRGSGTDTSRYSGDTTFYTTAPIRGLVYTVVHDPPGGNSFASIAQGTRRIRTWIDKYKSVKFGCVRFISARSRFWIEPRLWYGHWYFIRQRDIHYRARKNGL